VKSLVSAWSHKIKTPERSSSPFFDFDTDKQHGLAEVDVRLDDSGQQVDCMMVAGHVATLYSGTVRFNILLGATKPMGEVTQMELEEACRKANILDFIRGLPEYDQISPDPHHDHEADVSDRGFDTEVGGKGSQLSGGQKRRPIIVNSQNTFADVSERTHRYCPRPDSKPKSSSPR